MTAFHAAYGDGRLVAPPDEYTDLILIPMYLHIDPLALADYPPLLRERLRGLLVQAMAGGWAGNPRMIKEK